MSRQVVLTFGRVPPEEVRGNSRAHYNRRAATTRQMREDAYFSTLYEKGRAGIESFQKVKVDYAFYNTRFIDLDNLIKGAKPWLDGISKDAKLFPDDSPKYMSFGSITFDKCKKGEEKTIITITGIE